MKDHAQQLDRPTTDTTGSAADVRSSSKPSGQRPLGPSTYFFIGATFLFAASAFATAQWTALAGLALVIPALVILVVAFVLFAREMAVRP